jgi:hypothetical protein
MGERVMNDQEITHVVDRILKENLASKGFEKANVASEVDFDGSSIIRVRAHYQNGEVPSDDIIKSLHQIRDELLSKGEERFVILQSDYEGDLDDEGAEEIED